MPPSLVYLSLCLTFKMDNASLFFLIFGLSRHSVLADDLMYFGAQTLIFLTVILIFTLAFRGGPRERKALVLSLISFPIIILLIKVLHLFYIEPRPFVTYPIHTLINIGADASFPSRHASFMGAMAFSFYYFKSRWTYPLIFLALWVGVARVYVGVHYPYDIVGGFLIGIVSALISVWIIRKLKVRFLPIPGIR